MYDNTFFVLDFDRCTGDTDGIQALLEEVIQAETGISPVTFHQRRDEIEATGQTFATIRHLHLLLEEAGSSVTWEHIRTKLVEAAMSRDLLLPGTRDLLRILEEREIPHGIITYGVEEAWQLTKLEIAGMLHVPHLVTRIEHKSEILTGWRHENGFIIPPALLKSDGSLVVEHIVFLDDKAKSFQGVPAGVRGVHVVAPGGNKLPSQQGELPESVVDVTGIPGAIDLLFNQ